MRSIAALACVLFVPAISLAGGRDAECDRLVDQLQAISEPGPFYGADVSIGFRGGVLTPIPIRKGEFRRQRYREDLPPYAPALARLIKLGIKALPTLLDHLTDARPTRLRLPLNEEAPDAWYVTQYDPRHRSPLAVLNGHFPWDFTALRDHLGDERFDPSKGYRVRVGDLCYLAVGKIVNRHLDFLWYSSSRYRASLISSPVHDRILALRTRSDWSGLVPSEHWASLEFDILHNRMPYLSLVPLRTLATFYPEEAARFVSTLLARPVGDLNMSNAYTLTDPGYPEARWKDALMQERPDWFKTAFPTVVGILSLNGNPRGVQERAKRFMAAYFPHFDVLHPPLTTALSRDDLLALIEETAQIPSPELDGAILDAFQRADATPPDYYGDPEKVDQMAFAAVQRPGLRNRFDVFRAYFEKRLKITRIVTRYTDPPEQPEKMRAILKAMSQK